MPLRYAFLLCAALATLAAGSVRAQTYVEFFEIPGNPTLHGLDFHDGSLWAVVRSSSEPRILQIDPDDGSVLSTISLGEAFPTPLGLTWDGENFRVSESFTSSPEIFTVSPEGAVLDQIPAPSQLSNGLAFIEGFGGDQALLVAKAHPDDEAGIVVIDAFNGDVLNTLPFPSTQPGGIALLYDGTMWATNVGDDSGSDIEVLWKLDRITGDVLDTLEVPTGAGRPRGLAYDGAQFLYAVMDEPGGFDDVIYKIDLSTEGTPVYADDVDVLDFGVVDTSLPVGGAVTITNEGDAPLEIGEQTLTGSSAFVLASDGDPFTLAPGESGAVELFALAFDYGPLEATLSFTTNDVANATVEISVVGFGVIAEPDVGVAEDEHDFGEVRIENPYGSFAQALWPLQIIGTGDLDPTVTGITISGDADAFSIPDLDYPLQIATFDTVTVLVAFAPPAVGAYAATLTLATENPNEPTIDVTLTGIGVDPEIEGGDALWTLTVPDNPNTSFDDLKITHIASAGDLTGDGNDDLIVGTENYLVFAVNGNGWGTGDVLWSFDTCTDNNNCGAISGTDGLFETALETGHDLDGDGTPDVIFSTDGGNDHVFALSGVDGSVIWEVGSETDPFLASYYSVSARFDVTGDGVPDVATGTGTASAQSPNPFNNRRVYGLDGATGEELWSRTPGLPSFVVEQIALANGEVLAVAGGGEDPNRFVSAWAADDGLFLWTHEPQTTPFVFAPYPLGDGGEDLLYTGNNGLGSTNRLVRLDGLTGEVVWQQTGLATGWAIAVTDDLNGNGSADVAVGTSSGALRVVDGDDGTPIWAVTGFTQVFGVAALRDVTGDGIADLSAATGGGRALLLSGADGSTVWGYTIGNGTLDQAAEVVAVVPDIDGNGAPEIAVGSRHGRLALLASTGDILTASDDDAIPTAFSLDGGYPNPFREQTTLGYTLPEAVDVRLTVYDVLGRRVRTLVAEPQAAGTYNVVWDGRGAAGARAASGVYIARLEAGRSAATQRLVLVR
ncbi:MAG: PQQ-binding-like beta-propeller repeat protein [Rhodothermales bacterium]